MSNSAENEGKSLFSGQHHSLPIRIWHWMTFLLMTATLVTVLLGSTIYKTNQNIDMVKEKVEQKGGQITNDQARNVAHEFSEKLWELHTYIGYGLCLLLLSRFLIEASQSKDEKLRGRIKKALTFNVQVNNMEKDRKHFLWVNRGYLFFYGMFFVMALTGLGLAFEDVTLLKELHKPIKQIHEFVQYGIYAYILVHLVGVIRTDVYHSKGLVSSMINGGDNL